MVTVNVTSVAGMCVGGGGVCVCGGEGCMFVWGKGVYVCGGCMCVFQCNPMYMWVSLSNE